MHQSTRWLHTLLDLKRTKTALPSPSSTVNYLLCRSFLLPHKSSLHPSRSLLKSINLQVLYMIRYSRRRCFQRHLEELDEWLQCIIFGIIFFFVRIGVKVIFYLQCTGGFYCLQERRNTRLGWVLNCCHDRMLQTTRSNRSPRIKSQTEPCCQQKGHRSSGNHSMCHW